MLTMVYLVARVKSVWCVELALSLAAAVRQRGRSHERLMMEPALWIIFHRATVGLPLAGDPKFTSASATVCMPQFKI